MARVHNSSKPSNPNETVVSVEGHRIKLTNLDKVLYPETGTTKADVLDYYARIGHVLIPHAANRPATRKRWVHGVGTAENPGQMFFQKNLDDSTPSWVPRRSIEHRSHDNEYPLINDLATLTWLAQIASLELHVPQWQFGRTGTPRNPDRMVLDLDPGPGTGLAECAHIAMAARLILKDMGLDPLPVTSGSKGIHLYAALDGKQTSDQVSAVAHELARALEADHPDLVVSDMKKSLRDGKVLVDWSQNSSAKTTIVPYSLRGRDHPTAAAPRTWDEIESPGLAQLDYSEVLSRVDAHGDLLEALSSAHLKSLEPTPAHLDSFTSTPDAADRLTKYRSMRDGEKTPEPVPQTAAAPSDGRSFVIQEHHASRLHWDFRLEHDGVLVSWALPKGVPDDPSKNHLAVQTEDHPLEYGTFEGSIPAGEYGGGEVTIWDAGEYELEKWRDKEVIATLHGRPDGGLKGPTRVALIKTGGFGRGSSGDAKDQNNWLIHRMALEPSTSDAKAGKSGSGKSEASKSESGKSEASKSKSGKSEASKSEASAAPSPVTAPTDAPVAIKPMLATMGSAADITSDEQWAFEMKWDGIRAIAVVDKRDPAAPTVQLISRNGIDMSVTYPELTALAAATNATTAVFDGEIVALNSKNRPDFGRLQKRMKLTKPADVERARKQVPVNFMLFDVLALDGDPLTESSYDDRRQALESSVRSKGAIQVPPAFSAEGKTDAEVLHDALASSLELGLEGVMAKKREADYLPGGRSSSWIKLKHHLAQEVVIVGWRPGKGRRADSVGSLLMAVPGDNGLEYVGRVGTGFGDRELDQLKTDFAALARKTSPLSTSPGSEIPRADAADAQWISPKLVGEVEFAEWTSTGRLRQPAWRGWRSDKAASDVVRETK
jgi:bifunctional non-homologous end joining protein LigD